MVEIRAGQNLHKLISGYYKAEYRERALNKIVKVNKIKNPDFVGIGQKIAFTPYELMFKVQEGSTKKLLALGLATLNDLITKVEQDYPIDDIVEPFQRPSPENVLSSRFGWRRNPFTAKKRYILHPGIDIYPDNSKRITAANSGVVIFADHFHSYGLLIVLKHKNGPESYYTLYAHAAQVSVRPGERVCLGEELGAIGNTGVTTGQHLHFEILDQDGKPLNPLDGKQKRKVPKGTGQMSAIQLCNKAPTFALVQDQTIKLVNFVKGLFEPLLYQRLPAGQISVRAPQYPAKTASSAQGSVSHVF